MKKQSYLKINKDVLGLVQEQKDVSVHMGCARLSSTDLLWPPFLYTYETSAENSFPPHQSLVGEKKQISSYRTTVTYALPLTPAYFNLSLMFSTAALV